MSTAAPSPRRSRRHRLASALEEIGLTALAGRLPNRAGLIVLNYHRIGDAAATPYYSGVFSATAAGFEAQVAWLAARCRLVSLREAITIVEAPAAPPTPRPPVLISFDDGYRDNVEVALPILVKYGAPAAFFVATSFIGTGRVPWWDAIARAVRLTSASRLRAAHPFEIDLPLDGDRPAAIESLLRLYKTAHLPDLVSRIENALGVTTPPAPDLFMDWNGAAAMVRAGMAIGSHTHNHEILASLSRDRQEEELRESRHLIEQRLGARPEAFAYPEGAADSFTSDSRAALAATGYRAAFSYYGGVNGRAGIDRYDIRRIPVVAGLTLPLFKLRVTLAGAVGATII